MDQTTKRAANTLVLGMDPGLNTGIAVYHRGRLSQLLTVFPDEIASELDCFLAAAEVEGLKLQVVFEDSRKESRVFSAKKSMNEARKMKVARDVGGIDSWCVLIERECAKRNVQCLGISPKEKGGKVAPSAFEHVTGWVQGSNQHERDAAMVARDFRKGFAV